MPTHTLLTLTALLITSLGSIQGPVFQAFCTDTGQRGYALSTELACFTVDCDTAFPEQDSCENDECCSFNEIPRQPLVSRTAPSSFGDATSATPALIPAADPAAALDDLHRRLADTGHPPGIEPTAFAGHRLPLRI